MSDPNNMIIMIMFNLRTESVEHISTKELQSGTSIMAENPGIAMMYVYNDITDEMLY